MFTGIVEHVAEVRRIGPAPVHAGAVELVVDAGPVVVGVSIGDSVSVSGCCLTVTSVDGEELAFEAVPETLRKTSLGDLAAGSVVNLERALRADGRFDGHIVQGHVDATGSVVSLDRDGADVVLCVDCPDEVGDLLVPKGSVAIDGVSLTVVDPEPARFRVALIPHTLVHTTLGRRRPGDRVNLEVDVIGKYVHHYLSARPTER